MKTTKEELLALENRAVALIEDIRREVILCADAIKYVLDRVQTNKDFHYQVGPGTEAFRRLVIAEAAILGVDPAAHEAKRSEQHWEKM